MCVREKTKREKTKRDRERERARARESELRERKFIRDGIPKEGVELDGRRQCHPSLSTRSLMLQAGDRIVISDRNLLAERIANCYAMDPVS